MTNERENHLDGAERAAGAGVNCTWRFKKKRKNVPALSEGKETAISSYYAALMASSLSGAMHLPATILCLHAFSGDPWFTSDVLLERVCLMLFFVNLGFFLCARGLHRPVVQMMKPM